MALKVAFQIGPDRAHRYQGDSTSRLLLEAQWRGHDVFYYTPDDLSLKDGTLMAEGHSLTVEDKPATIIGWRTRGPRSREYDVVQLRQDPPSTWRTSLPRSLGAHPPADLVVNDRGFGAQLAGEGVRARFSRSHAADAGDPSPEEIRAFRDRHKDIVVKPLTAWRRRAISASPKATPISIR